MIRIVTLAAVFTVAALLVACGGGGEPETCEPTGTTISVVASGTSFDTGCLAVPAGQGFTVEFTNKDSFGHNFTVREDGQDVFVVGGPPGKTSTETLDPLEAGTYEFLCTIHPQMNGTFIAA